MDDSREQDMTAKTRSQYSSEKRKRINRYKKIIVRILLVLIVVSIILWIYVILKINILENKIDNVNAGMINEIWRIVE